MPPRISRSALPAAKFSPARNKNKKRALNAYASASRSVPERKVPQHRLGETTDDEPRQKRRRTENDEDDDDDDEEERPTQKARTTQRRSANDGDDVQYGSDSSGNEWTMGGLGAEDEDSDLDSDEAFGESDEERFEGFTFRGSKSSGKRKKRPVKSKPSQHGDNEKVIDLYEAYGSESDSDDSQDGVGAGLGEDAIDLAAMLDDNESEAEDVKPKRTSRARAAEDDATDSEDGEDDDNDEASASTSDSDEHEDEQEGSDAGPLAEERNARMLDLLDNLDPSGAAPGDAETTTGNAAATLDDFLEDTIMENDKTLAGSKNSSKSAKSSILSAPLPKRQQDRIDRGEASKQAKKQLDRWKDTVTQNRRAEFLTFPLQDPTDQSGTRGKDKFAPVAQQKPRTDLEESIAQIMEESGLASKLADGQAGAGVDEETAVLKSEELAIKRLDMQEMLRRRAELRLNRELLFREEIKAKRIAKIKSKSYRRVHRKERGRLAEQEQRMREELGEDGLDEDEQERHDRLRAEARMGTKHKDSKWAKSLKATDRAVWDDNARDGVIEQARRTEELKRRIAGEDISDSAGSDADSEGSEGADDLGSVAKQLSKLSQPEPAAIKGLAGMKFMQAAAERRRAANDETVERLRKDLAIADGNEAEDEEIDDNGIGRAIFGPRPEHPSAPAVKEKRLEFEAPDLSAEEDGDIDNGEDRPAVKSSKPTTKSTPKSILKKTGPSSGPLARSEVADKLSSSRKAKAIDDNDWLNKPDGKDDGDWLEQVPKSRRKRTINADVATIDHDFQAAATIDHGSKASVSGQGIAPATNGHAESTVVHDGEADSEAEAEEQEDPVLQQQSLVERAFAGDDTQAAFDAEKDELAESEDEKEVSNYLAGWGSWAGAGLNKQQKRQNARMKHNPLFKTKTSGVRQADRRDAKLDNVIITEKQDRKGKKYLATTLPHEFETREQYERSRRLPMGPEWTTKEVHQRMTRPRVVVNKGVVGQALLRPLV